MFSTSEENIVLFITNLRYVQRIFIPSIIIRIVRGKRFFLFKIQQRTFNENNKFRIFKVSSSFFLNDFNDFENLQRKTSKIVIINFLQIFSSRVRYIFPLIGKYITIHGNNTESQSCADLSFKI